MNISTVTTYLISSYSLVLVLEAVQDAGQYADTEIHVIICDGQWRHQPHHIPCSRCDDYQALVPRRCDHASCRLHTTLRTLSTSQISSGPVRHIELSGFCSARWSSYHHKELEKAYCRDATKPAMDTRDRSMHLSYLGG